MMRKLVLVSACGLLLLASCSGSDETAGEDFCPVWEVANAEVEPDQVGTTDAIQRLEDLQAVAPETVDSEIGTVITHFESGAVDYESDPSSVDVENFPVEVQSAIERLRSFATDEC